MNINDQWFEPGDKVMRVAKNRPHPSVLHREDIESPRFGVIYCVTRCWNSGLGRYNVISLAGFHAGYLSDGITERGYCASNFRRVEEIKLCVEAAAKMKQPKKSTVLVGDGEEEG